jgi:hypothetical protein
MRDGDSISTDEFGEASLIFGECAKVFIYQNSGLMKRACPRADIQGANLAGCVRQGTASFNECASKVRIQSDSAQITLDGTWVSVTYLEQWQLTVLLVFEGKANANAVTDFESWKLDEESTHVPTKYFWFSVPNDKLKEFKALNVGLVPRRAYPFERLPELLGNENLKMPSLRPVEERAVAAGVVTPDIGIYFPPYTRPDSIGGGPQPPRGPANPDYGPPPSFAALPFGQVKVGRPSTSVIPLQGVSSPDPSRVTLYDPSDVFTSNIGADGRLNVTFHPKKAGAFAGKLTYRSADGRNYYVSLSGAGSNPQLEFSAHQLQFNSIDNVATLTLKNNSAIPAELGNVLIISDAGNYYGKLEDTCNRKTIGIGPSLEKECFIKVKLHRGFGDVPGQTTEVAKLVINHDDPKQSKTVNLEGLILPVVRVSEKLMFKDVAVPDECEKILPLVNHGTQRVKIDKASIIGPHQEEFRIVKDTCGDLGVGRRCEITVAFKPAVKDMRRATLTIPDNTRASPHIVELSGQGIDPVVTISGTPSFGNQRIESVETVKTLTILNPRNSPIQVKDIFITGPNKAEFKYLSDTCRLKPVESKCEVRVAYKPGGEGASQANLVVVTSDSSVITSSVILNNLGGTNQTSNTNAVSARPVARDADAPCDNHQLILTGAGFKVPQKLCFDAKKVVDSKNVKTRQTLTIPINNQSQAPFAITASISGKDKEDFRIENPDACKDPRKPCSITVGFTPRKTDKRQAVLALSHDPTSPPVNVDLKGEGKSRCPVVRAAKWFVHLFKRDKKPCE